MKNIVLILKNTLRVTFRRRSSYALYLVLPVMGVVLAVVIMSGSSVQPVRVGIVNHDVGALGSDLVADISDWGNYRTRVVASADVDREVTHSEIDLAIQIPADFTATAHEGRPAAIEIVSVKGASVTAALENLINQYCAALVDIAHASKGSSAAFDSLYRQSRQGGARLVTQEMADDSSAKNATGTSIGYFVLFIMLGASMTAQLVLSEKRHGTFSRIMSAPVLPRHYIVANGTAGFVIILIQILLVIVAMRFVFGIGVHAPTAPLAATLALFGLVSVGLGLLITSFSSSSGMALGVTTLILTPSCMLAGSFWPVSIMPPFMQKLALFMPQRWVLDALQKMQSGTPVGGLAVNFLVLAAFALTFFALATYGFSRDEASGQFI